jgi:signal transduction histidine kinase
MNIRYIEFASSSGTILLNLINDILDVSKMEAGKLEVNESEVEIRRLVSVVTQLLAPQFTSKGLQLFVEVYCIILHLDIPIE